MHVPSERVRGECARMRYVQCVMRMNAQGRLKSARVVNERADRGSVRACMHAALMCRRCLMFVHEELFLKATSCRPNKPQAV